MRAGALTPYESARQIATPLSPVTADGTVLPLPIERYFADADDADATVLTRCIGPVLDVGCGPGRIVHALAVQGIPALGVDIADVAVALTNRRGAPALTRSVFERVPGEGRWPTVLVLDGNVGIGGDVEGLLRRVSRLIAAGGQLIVEASGAHPGADEVLTVRFGADDNVMGPQFEWALVDVAALTRHAEAVGLVRVDQWSADARDFVRFARDPVQR